MRFALILLCLVLPLSAQVRLQGIMSGGKNTLFAISVDGSPSRWVRAGETIGAFSVVSYDLREETVIFRKGADEVVARLPASIVRSAGPVSIVGSAESLRGLEFAFALALAGDEQIEEGFTNLKKAMDDRAALTKQLQDAEGAFAVSKSDGDRLKVAHLSRQVNTRVQIEDSFRRRVMEIADSKTPKAPEPTPGSGTPRVNDPKVK